MKNSDMYEMKWGGVATYLDTFKTPAVKDLVAYLKEHGIVLSQNQKEAFSFCESEAKSGSDMAEYALACLYAYGFGIKEDIDLAISWCKKAAFSGVARAKWFLAVLIASRSGSTKEDWSMVKEYLIDAKNQGDVEARYTIALLAYSGKIEDYSKASAISEFEELATTGHTGSKSILAGELLQEGRVESEKRAIDLVIEAANDEDPAAIYLLSSFYLSGMYGFPKDKEKSDYYMNMITENKEE